MAASLRNYTNIKARLGRLLPRNLNQDKIRKPGGSVKTLEEPPEM